MIETRLKRVAEWLHEYAIGSRLLATGQAAERIVGGRHNTVICDTAAR